MDKLSRFVSASHSQVAASLWDGELISSQNLQMLKEHKARPCDPTHLCEFHLQCVVISNAGIKVGDLLCRRLDLVDDHDVGVDDDACGKDQAEEEDGHDEGLA